MAFQCRATNQTHNHITYLSVALPGARAFRRRELRVLRSRAGRRHADPPITFQPMVFELDHLNI